MWRKNLFCDAAYSKQSQDHVSGLLCTGISAQEYYLLDNPDSIVSSVIQELDEYFNGLASQNYLESYIQGLGSTYLYPRNLDIWFWEVI